MVEPLSLLKQYPSTLLGLQLTSLQQVLCCFVVPAIANCTIYIIDFASNVAVVYRHFQESNVRWAISTLLFMYVPSLVFFTLTVSNVDKWNEHFDQSNVLKWFFARLLYLVAFPILGIYRYAKIIFWSIDALFRQGNDREESLKNVTRPSHIELYLFLHAYLQGIPQAILQLSILYIEHNDNHETDSMQVLCIASSLMIVATTTVSFQRFESQKILGRLKPWANIPPRNDTATIEGKQQEDEVSKTIEPEEDESVKRESDAEGSTPYLQPRTIATNEIAEAINEAAISLSSENSSEKFFERTPELLPRQSFIQYSENPYADPRTLIGNFPPQDSNFHEPQSLRPPSLPPPPPPPRTPPPIRKPLEFPTRKIPVKGLEQDELMGKSVSFLAWFFFLSGRVISLVSCFHFFPWLGFGISLFHYAVTLLVLHKNAKTISTVLLKMSLAFIYCFCLFEWKVIFKKVYLIYTIFFFTTTVENLVSSTAWYLLGDWEGWWYNYTYFLIWGCHVISIMCILMYFFILKPNSRMFYPEDSK